MQEFVIRYALYTIILIIAADYAMSKLKFNFRLRKWIPKKLGELLKWPLKKAWNRIKQRALQSNPTSNGRKK